MKRRRLRPEDRHITAAECHALIVHTINQLLDAIRESQPGNTTAQADIDAIYDRMPVVDLPPVGGI